MRLSPLLFLPVTLAAITVGSSTFHPTHPGWIAEAQAQDALSTCSLKGTPILGRGISLFDAQKGGSAIADFIGSTIPLTLTVPGDPINQRAKVSISAGKPTLRLEGWLAMDTIPVYSIKDVSVVDDHVHIAAGHRVKLTKGAKNKLFAELMIAGSSSQVLKGSGGCDAFSLVWVSPNTPEPPEKARPYLMKGTSLELFDKPNGENIFSLEMSDGASPLLHSIEIRGMFQHVVSRSDIVLDGWIKMGTLSPIKKGDRIESPPSAPYVGASSHMTLESPPPLKTATKDVLVRPSRDDSKQAIGVLEKGAEFYVTQQVAGWANILPKELYFSPPNNGGFWVRSDQLP